MQRIPFLFPTVGSHTPYTAERLRVKARHDEAQALHNAGKEISQNMKADGGPIEKIIRDNPDYVQKGQIESLKNQKLHNRVDKQEEIQDEKF